jgi:internalin A
MNRGTTIGLVLVGLLQTSTPGRTDEAQEKAIGHIKKLGGGVKRDEDAPGKPIVAVILSGRPSTDEDLKCLAAFKELKTLRVCRHRLRA